MHEITVYESAHDGESVWCACHRHDGEFDSTDPLPDAAQADPVAWLKDQYPDASVGESSEVQYW